MCEFLWIHSLRQAERLPEEQKERFFRHLPKCDTCSHDFLEPHSGERMPVTPEPPQQN